MWAVKLPVGLPIGSWLTPKYKRPLKGTMIVPSAPTRNGVAARSLPTCPTRAPRAALGTERARRVSFQSRAAPCGPTPGLSVKSTVPVAVMWSLSPAATSIPVSTHCLSPETVTSLLVGDLVLAAVCHADNDPARQRIAHTYAEIERYCMM